MVQLKLDAGDIDEAQVEIEKSELLLLDVSKQVDISEQLLECVWLRHNDLKERAAKVLIQRDEKKTSLEDQQQEVHKKEFLKSLSVVSAAFAFGFTICTFKQL